MVAYSTPMTPAPITVMLRGSRSISSISSLSNTRLRSNGMLSGRCGRVPTEISAWSNVASLRSPFSVTSSTRFWLDEFRPGMKAAHAVAHELVLQHLDFVVERLVQPLDQVAGGNILLDPIAPSVKAPLAPAGQVEHRLAQCLRRDRAGMNRNAAEPPPLVDHQHGLAELGRLNRRAASGRAGADDDHVEMVHGGEPAREGLCSAPKLAQISRRLQR